MLAALLCAALVAAPPALEQTVDAGALVWVEVPELGPSVKALERSAFASLLGLMLPPATREALARTPAGSLVAALYRGEAPGSTELAMWIEAGRAAPAIAAQLRAFYAGLGLGAAASESIGELSLERLGGPGEGVTVFSGAGRCGVSEDPGRAARALQASGQPLGSSHELAAVKKATPGAQVRGRVDLQRWYGLLARTRRGPQLAQTVRRLGLDRLAHVTLQGRLVDARTLRLEARAVMPRPWRGIAGVLGDQVEPAWPAAVPDAALWRLKVAVRPRAAYELAESMLAYASPIELALARAQLRDLETRMGKKLGEDALGDEARPWSLYQVEAKGGALETVLVAEVADAALAGRILGAYAGLLAAVFPQLGIERGQRQGVPVLSLAGAGARVAVAFTAKEVVVASSKVALQAHLSRRGKKRPVAAAAEDAVAYVAAEDGALAAALLSRRRDLDFGAWAPVAAALRRGGLGARELRSTLAGTTGAVRQVADGLVLELVTRGR